MNSEPTLMKRDIIDALLLTFCLFFIASPYFFWTWYGLLLPKLLATMIAGFLFYKHKEILTQKDQPLLVLFVFIWLFYSFNEFTKGARLGVVATFPYVLLGYVPFVKKEFGSKVFNYFVTIYAIIIGLSMISWIAAMAGYLSPIGVLGEGNESLEAQRKTYLVFPLALVSTKDMGDYIRFCGVFDEPGVVGTLSALILCAMRYDMKNWRNIIILLSGLLTTSMFFYAITGIYWLLYLFLVRKKIGTFLVVIISFFAFYELTKDNDAISNLVWERFEWDSSSGTFSGNTRADERSYVQMEKMISSGEIWLGVKDKTAFWDDNFGSSSIYNIIALYGLLVTIMYYGIWLIGVGYRFKINIKDFLLYVFVAIGCSYQRPGFYDILYVFLFVSIARYRDFYLQNKD